MIATPIFEEVRASAELPAGSHATCHVCGRDVDAVALVGMIPNPGKMLYVEGLGLIEEPTPILAKTWDRLCVLVGPCGHSTLDAGEDGYVYDVAFDGDPA